MTDNDLQAAVKTLQKEVNSSTDVLSSIAKFGGTFAKNLLFDKKEVSKDTGKPTPWAMFSAALLVILIVLILISIIRR
jgi:hypothetical protein